MTPNCEARNRSTVAPQSLLLMNDTFVLDTSKALATRLRNEVQGDARGQIVKAWRTLYGEQPRDTDIFRCLAYLAEQTEAVRAYHHGIQHAKDAPPPIHNLRRSQASARSSTARTDSFTSNEPLAPLLTTTFPPRERLRPRLTRARVPLA